jgi:hypothetical protein
MKKNAKEQKTQKTIQSKTLKEIIPSTYQHIQEPTPIIEPQDPHPEYIPQTIPSEVFEEWTNETEQIPLLSFEQQQQSYDIFTDPNNNKIILPYSLTHEFITDEVKWIRPNTYVMDNHLDNEIIKTLPNRNHVKFRLKVHEMYLKDKEIELKKSEGEYYANESEEGSEDSYGIENRDKFEFY